MSQVSLIARDGHQLGAYRAQPAGPARGALVVIQEIFGVTQHIRDVCDGYAADGYLAIAPALFDREERGLELSYAAEGFRRGAPIARKLDAKLTQLDLEAARDACAADGGGMKIGVIGFCYGGTLAWLSAVQLDGVACAVGYYGSYIARMNHLQPRVPVMLHFGERDALIPPTDVEQIRSAHPEVAVHVYAADHGFNCDHRASFDAAAAALARSRTLAFFGKHLSG